MQKFDYGKQSVGVVELVNYLNIPVTNTLMGLGSIPASNKRFLGMLGVPKLLIIFLQYILSNSIFSKTLVHFL